MSKRFITSPHISSLLIAIVASSLFIAGCESKVKDFLDSLRPTHDASKSKKSQALLNEPVPEHSSNDEEPNNRKEEANPIVLTPENRPIAGKLSDKDDIDWYKLSADLDKPATVNLHATSPDTNVKLSIYAHDGTPLRSITSNNEGKIQARLSNLSVSRRPIYLSIESDKSSETSKQTLKKNMPYRIFLTRQLAQGPFEAEPNDRPILATSSPLPDTITGTFDTPDDTDYFKISTQTTQIAKLTVRAPEDCAMEIEITSLIDNSSQNLASKGLSLFRTQLAPNESFTLPNLDLTYKSRQTDSPNIFANAGVLLRLTPVDLKQPSEKPYIIDIQPAPLKPGSNPSTNPTLVQIEEYEPNNTIPQELPSPTVQIFGTLATPTDVDHFQWREQKDTTPPPAPDSPAGVGSLTENEAKQPSNPAAVPTPAGNTLPQNGAQPTVAAAAPAANTATTPPSTTTQKLPQPNYDWGPVIPKPAPEPIYSATATPLAPGVELTLSWTDQKTLSATSEEPGAPAVVCGLSSNTGLFNLSVQLHNKEKNTAPSTEQPTELPADEQTIDITHPIIDPTANGDTPPIAKDSLIDSAQPTDKTPEAIPTNFMPVPYTVAITGFDNGMQESEPNNSYANADRLLPGESRKGLISSTNDLDIWAFQVPKRNLLAAPAPTQPTQPTQPPGDTAQPTDDTKDQELTKILDTLKDEKPVPQEAEGKAAAVPNTAPAVKPTTPGTTPPAAVAAKPAQPAIPPSPTSPDSPFRHVVITATATSLDLTLFVVDQNGATLAIENTKRIGETEKVELDLPPALYFVKVSSDNASCDPYTISLEVTN